MQPGGCVFDSIQSSSLFRQYEDTIDQNTQTVCIIRRGS